MPRSPDQQLLDDDWPKQGTWDMYDSVDGVVTLVTSLDQLWHTLRPVPPGDEQARRELLVSLMSAPSWRKAPAELKTEADAFLAATSEGL